VNGGFDTPTNLEDLTYAKFMSCSPHIGNIDISYFTFDYEDANSNAKTVIRVVNMEDSDDDDMKNFSGSILYTIILFYYIYSFILLDIGFPLKEKQSLPVTSLPKSSLRISKSVGDKSAVPIDVLVNIVKYKGKAYVGTTSGMIFDVGVNDESLSTVHVIDTFVGKCEKSIYRCGFVLLYQPLANMSL
jgi:hypothetical protein